MSNRFTSINVCMQNFRKWKSSYKIWVVFALVFIINNYNTSWFVDFADNIGSTNGVAPWVFIFSVSNAFGFSRIMLFFPLIILYCNAPFIDGNQMFVLARCSRKKWCLGQLIYILVSSLVYVLASFLLSLIGLAGRMDLTSSWGNVISTAAKASTTRGAVSTGVSRDIVYYFSPQTALFFTILLFWFACIFIGLIIYVFNIIFRSSGYGVLVACGFVVFSFLQDFIRLSDGRGKYDWLLKLSPVSWCSIQNIYVDGDVNLPSIQYVLIGFSVLIVGLSVVAFLSSKKQEISAVIELS